MDRLWYAWAVDSLRIATLNIWNRSGPWEERRALIRRGIEGLAPDVMGLQEVLQLVLPDDSTTDQAQQIVEGLGWSVAFGRGHELGHGLWFGNALVTPHPILSREVHELPGTERSDQQRCVLHVVVDAPVGPLHCFVTHLNWKLHEGAIRQRQVRFIADLIARLAPLREAPYPPILMGDLNAEPQSDEIRFLSGYTSIDDETVYLADAFRHAGEGDGATFDPRNPYAASIHLPPRRIDYVFVRGPDAEGRGKPLSAKVVFDEPDGEVWPSDHFGVMADLAT